mgnify:CR=1 FL=1
MTDATPPQGLAARAANYGDRAFALYLRRSFIRSAGYSDAMLGRPVIGIADTRSDLNSCHRTAPELVEAVKRGVLAAGGLPLAFPTISLCEPFLTPTSMHYRNLMALDTEAMLSAQPLDAVVLLGGCDKTVPAQLMAAISAGVPAVQFVVGPMSAMRFEGERLAACTDCRRFWAAYRAGRVDDATITRVEGALATTSGTCGVMGTASTMAAIAAVLGFMPLDAASIPAVHADRLRAAEAAGEQAMRVVARPVAPAALLTPDSLDNALVTLLALGGSTNAVVHLAAIAGRAGLKLDLKRLDALSDRTPVLVDLKPTGEGYMEDFHAAGGLRVLLHELRDLLHLDTPDLDGVPLQARIGTPHYADHRVIRRRDDPVSPLGGLIALTGTLAPDGAILKRAAATPSLFEHEGRAIVFDGLEDLARRIDDDALDVTRAGVKDMVRISDCRMSGTAFGTTILHVAPEAAAGGPLALAETGDRIRLSVRERRLDLLVDDATLAARRARWTPPETPPRGWDRLVAEQVLQAPDGADLAFLRPAP